MDGYMGEEGGDGDNARWRAGLLPEDDIRACTFDGRWIGKQVDRESVNQDGMHAMKRCEKNTKCRQIT